MTIKTRNIDNGKKWGRLHETLRAWVQGRERLMHSLRRGRSYLSENEGTREFLGSFTESSPVWRSTELPLNPWPEVKAALLHLQSTSEAQVLPKKHHLLLPFSSPSTEYLCSQIA